MCVQTQHRTNFTGKNISAKTNAYKSLRFCPGLENCGKDVTAPKLKTRDKILLLSLGCMTCLINLQRKEERTEKQKKNWSSW